MRYVLRTGCDRARKARDCQTLRGRDREACLQNVSHLYASTYFLVVLELNPSDGKDEALDRLSSSPSFSIHQ